MKQNKVGIFYINNSDEGKRFSARVYKFFFCCCIYRMNFQGISNTQTDSACFWEMSTAWLSHYEISFIRVVGVTEAVHRFIQHIHEMRKNEIGDYYRWCLRPPNTSKRCKKLCIDAIGGATCCQRSFLNSLRHWNYTMPLVIRHILNFRLGWMCPAWITNLSLFSLVWRAHTPLSPTQCVCTFLTTLLSATFIYAIAFRFKYRFVDAKQEKKYYSKRPIKWLVSPPSVSRLEIMKFSLL